NLPWFSQHLRNLSARQSWLAGSSVRVQRAFESPYRDGAAVPGPTLARPVPWRLELARRARGTEHSGKSFLAQMTSSRSVVLSDTPPVDARQENKYAPRPVGCQGVNIAVRCACRQSVMFTSPRRYAEPIKGALCGGRSRLWLHYEFALHS